MLGLLFLVFVFFISVEGSGDAKAISPDAVNALVWEKRYHLEVGIRTELKRVLDTTTHQLNEARDGTTHDTHTRTNDPWTLTSMHCAQRSRL
jgi:hypothetical protein